MDFILKIVFNVFIPLFALGIVVFVHELGHFVVARRNGITVEVFSVGFGPRITGFNKKGTDYRISLIPFGGYVKFFGDDIEDEKARSLSGGFYAASPFVRTKACVAGPAMNILFGFLLYCVVAITGKPVLTTELTTVVGGLPDNSPAMNAGMTAGDRILSINGRKVSSWKEVVNSIVLSSEEILDIRFERDAITKNLLITPIMDEKFGVRRIGILPMEKIAVWKVLEKSPAEKAGLKKGDQIVSLNGKQVTQWDSLLKEVADSQGKILSIGIIRDGRELKLDVIPQMNAEIGRVTIGFIRHYEFELMHPNPFKEVWNDIRNIFMTLRALIMKKVSAKGLAGPVGIIQIMGQYASIGFIYFISVLAMISINLGIINLFPIPVLDGGHILLNSVEQLRGKALGKRTMAVIQNIFVVLLIGLILLITYNDVLRWVKPWFSKEKVEEKVDVNK
jgi:regulator of sigma E protease